MGTNVVAECGFERYNYCQGCSRFDSRKLGALGHENQEKTVWKDLNANAVSGLEA